MDESMKKKLMAVGAAALGAFMFGESQVMDMDARIQALEDIHPELKQEELDDIAEELQSESEDKAPEESSGSIDESDHLELNEDDEWVAAPSQEESDEGQEE